jgi:hypothetical protein
VCGVSSPELDWPFRHGGIGGCSNFYNSERDWLDAEAEADVAGVGGSALTDWPNNMAPSEKRRCRVSGQQEQKV